MGYARVIAAAALVAAMLPAAAGAAELYTCKFKVKSANKNWMPQTVYVRHDRDAGRAEAIDEFIAYYNDQRPIPVEVVADNAQRVTFSWRTEDYQDVQGIEIRIRYRMTALKGSSQGSMQGRPLNYADVFTNNGTCKTETVR